MVTAGRFPLRLIFGPRGPSPWGSWMALPGSTGMGTPQGQGTPAAAGQRLPCHSCSACRGAARRGPPHPASSPPPASLSLSSSSPSTLVAVARCGQLPGAAPVDLRGRGASQARVTREGRQKAPACTRSLMPQPCSSPSLGSAEPHCIARSPSTSGCHPEEAGPSSWPPAAAPCRPAGGPSRRARCSRWMPARPSGYPCSTLARGGRPAGPTFPWPGCLSRSRS